MSLAVFSIRFMSVGLIFDTWNIVIIHYLQGIGDTKRAKLYSLINRFIVHGISTVVLGYFSGSKGVLASIAVTEILSYFIFTIMRVIRIKKIPHGLEDFLYLPDDFGGYSTDNLYAKIRSYDDTIELSKKVQEFCLQHQIDERNSRMAGLFTEEMSVNISDHAKKVYHKNINIDYRLFISDKKVCFSLTDMGDNFDPLLFYEIHQNDDAEDHIGIRMVMNAASEVCYFSSFNSNNLIVSFNR